MLQTKQEIIFLIIAVCFILIVLAVLFIFSIIYFKNRNQKIAREKEQLKKDFEAQILKSQLEIQEQTFATIASELHDNAGQVLTYAKIQLSIASKKQPLPEGVSLAVDSITNAINIIRDVSRSLDTDRISKEALSTSIHKEIQRLQKINNVQFNKVVEGDELPMNGKNKIMVYRIVQEATNNILKHAKANNVTISLHFETAQAIITITDDGIGFDTALKADGSGIQNIHKRMKLINGKASIISSFNNGTTIQLQVPYQN